VRPFSFICLAMAIPRLDYYRTVCRHGVVVLRRNIGKQESDVLAHTLFGRNPKNFDSEPDSPPRLERKRHSICHRVSTRTVLHEACDALESLQLLPLGAPR